jgi:hypothetical protein
MADFGGWVEMKRLTTVLTTVLMISGVMMAAPAAHAAGAHAAPWRWKTVAATPQTVAGGTQGDVIIYCPAGYRPVSLEWHLDSTYSTSVYLLNRQAEYLDYGGNWGRLLFYNAHTVTRTVYASLNCVHGDDVGTISVVGKDFTPASGGGFVACPSLTSTMIGGGADFGSYENGRSIDFSAPTSSGWYVNGHGATGVLHIEVYCIALGYQAGMHLVQHQAGATSSSVACSTGERVVSGGGYAYAVGGAIDPAAYKGYLVQVDQQRLTAGVLDVTAFISSGTASTWFVAEALCAPASIPSVLIYTWPTGDRSSPNISYTFTASDQAGEDLRYQCYLNGSAGYPCIPGTTPNTVSSLPDGSYSLAIEARNDSNQTDTETTSFRVDTTPPTVTVSGKPANPTQSRLAAFTVVGSDAGTGVAQVSCYLDSETDHTCPAPTNYSGLADGVHTFHWRAVDAIGNQSTGSYAWRVDTIAPTAALTAPTAPFTPSSATTVKWTGSDTGSGVLSWQIQWRRAPYTGGFGAWSSSATLPASTLSHTYTGLAPGYDYCFRIRSVDRVGLVSPYSSRCTAIPLDDRALAASSGWIRVTSSAYYAGTATYTTTLNATLTRSGAQLDRLALLVTKCAGCGVVGVYVNGVLIAKVNLYSSATYNRQLVQLAPFSYRTGTVSLKVLTSGKLVRIDGLGISRT